MIGLKQAGISDKEIAAMLLKNANPKGAAPPSLAAAVFPVPPPPLLPGVDDVGLYYKGQNGHWVNVMSENVNFKTGGVLKSAFTDGIVKATVTATLPGPRANWLYIPRWSSLGMCLRGGLQKSTNYCGCIPTETGANFAP